MPSIPSKYELFGPTFECDELLQKSIKNRTFLDDIHGCTKTTCEFTLPTSLLPTYWKRHNLSKQDLNSQQNYSEASTIWLLSLLYGVDSSSSSLKPSFSTATGVLVSSKAIAIRKLIRKLKIKFNSTSMISSGVASLVHIPGIPHNFVTGEKFEKISGLITPVLNIFEENVITGLIDYLDILWLPRSFENDSIYMVRVVLLEVFTKSGKGRTGALCSRGYTLLLDGVRYMTVEESVLVNSI